MFPESAVVCFHTHFVISLPVSHLAVVDRTASAAPAGTSGDGSDPPFYAAGAARKGRVCFLVCFLVTTPLSGVASVQFIPAGRLRTQTTRGRETRRRKTP